MYFSLKGGFYHSKVEAVDQQVTANQSKLIAYLGSSI